MKQHSLPREAIISVTNRCDARCSMCNIWQLEADEWLTAEDYRRQLPGSLKNVNLTGGEALLRKDIVEVAHAVYEAGGEPRIVLATNGFRTEKTLATVQQIRTYVPRLAIAVSIDGSPPTHDRMRGVAKAHERALRTIQGLKEIGISDIRIGFTAVTGNACELTDVYNLAESLDVELTATVAQNSAIYYATSANDPIDPAHVTAAFGALIQRRLQSRSVKNWLRAYFDAGVIRFASGGGRATRCRAASDFFFLSPKGEVYPCLTLPSSIGSLKSQTFDELWNSAAAQDVRRTVERCEQCWMMCTARTELMRHPLRVAGWVLGQQIRRLSNSKQQPL